MKTLGMKKFRFVSQVDISLHSNLGVPDWVSVRLGVLKFVLVRCLNISKAFDKI